MKRILSILISLASMMMAQAQINTDQVLQIGRNALYFEDYVLSIQYFNQVIAAKPYLAQPYFYRALAKYNLDDLSGAEQDASTAIEHNPFITDAYELRGVARQNLGRYAEAVEDYDKALEMLPENKGILYNKALAQEDLKDYDGAMASFEALLKAHPNFDGAYIGRAKLNLAKNDTIAALDDIEKALEINPNSTNAYVMRADIAINRNQDYQQALDDMDHAIKLQPRYSGFFVNRAFLRYKLDDYFGAMSDYDYAIQLDPVNAVALFNRSLLRTEVHDLNNALADLNQVISLRPQDHRAYYNRALVNRELRNYKAALADINHLIDEFPDLAAAYFLRYDIKQSLGDKSARKDYDKSIALAKHRVKRGKVPTSVTDVFGTGADNDDTDDDTEPQEVVAARFSQLITISDNTNTEEEYNTKGIRGRVQDRNVTIEPEPIFTVTYYTSPTELKPSGDYLREIDAVNATHALNYLLQVSNHEAPLTDANEIDKHFRSIEYYNSYISTHSPRAIDFFGLAMNQLTVHNYAAAATSFEQALRLAPDFALARFMMGVAKFRQLQMQSAESGEASSPALTKAKYGEVINDFDQAIKLSPNMALAYYNKGVVLIAMQDYTSALTALSKAIELKPDFGEAFYNRGYVYFTLGNRQAGSEDLSKAGQLGVAPSYNLLKRMTR